MPTKKFLPAQTHAPGAKPDLRRVCTTSIEWISERITTAAEGDLIEVRTFSGDLHRILARDLRVAFPSLRRARPVTTEV